MDEDRMRWCFAHDFHSFEIAGLDYCEWMYSDSSFGVEPCDIRDAMVLPADKTYYEKCERCAGMGGFTHPNKFTWIECEAEGCRVGMVPVGKGADADEAPPFNPACEHPVVRTDDYCESCDDYLGEGAWREAVGKGDNDEPTTP